MKTLFINAGAKNNGATQEILNMMVSELPAGSAGKIICLGDSKISFCRGCKTCYNTCNCICHDDMENLINLIDSSDKIIIAAPSYWGDIPGQFKAFIDRCTVYSNTNPNKNRRKLREGIKCCGIALRTGQNASECEHIIETIRHWCGHMEIETEDSMHFCGIEDKKDILKYENEIKQRAQKWLRDDL